MLSPLARPVLFSPSQVKGASGGSKHATLQPGGRDLSVCLRRDACHLPTGGHHRLSSDSVSSPDPFVFRRPESRTIATMSAEG